MHTRSSRTLIRVLLPLSVLCVTVPLSADYKEDYTEALEALKGERWSKAKELLEAAVALEPTEDKAVRMYGSIPDPYLPHYYLGVVLDELGDCEGALREWQLSEADQAIQGLRGRNRANWEDLQQRRGRCDDLVESTREEPVEEPRGPSPAALAAASSEAGAAMQRAQTAQQRVAELARSPELSPIWTQEAALGGAEAAARRSLELARAGLATGISSGDLDRIVTAGQQASDVESDLATIERLAGTRRDDEVARVAVGGVTALVTPARSALGQAGRVAVPSSMLFSAVTDLERSVRAAEAASSADSVEDLEGLRQEMVNRTAAVEEALKDQSSLEVLRRQVLGRVDRARSLLARADAAQSGEGLDEQRQALVRLADEASSADSLDSSSLLQTLSAGLDDANRALDEALAPVSRVPESPAPVGPPTELVEACAAFFGGDFEGALDLLEDARFSGSQARLQASLFRAAAHYSLYLSSGLLEEDRRAEAAAEVRACRSFDASFVPDEEVFSPGFVTFFRENG